MKTYSHEDGWTWFQTHNFTENLVAPGIEPGTVVGFEVFTAVTKKNGVF
jgi:hypothetical protein